MGISDPSVSVVQMMAPARFGGLETCVVSLAAGLRRAGQRVCVVPVLSPDEALPHPVSEELEARGVEVRPVVVGNRDYLGERRAIRGHLVDFGAQVLHTHGYRSDLVDGPVARALGLRTVSTVHGFTGGGVRARFYERLQKRALRGFDAVVAVSEKLRVDLAASGVPEPPLAMIQNAWEASTPPVGRSEARRRLGIEGDRPTIGWVGRLSREKAPDVFVRAAAATAGIDFRVVGGGPMLEECQRLADSLGLGGRMRWLGPVEGAGAMLSAFDAIAITSWTEGTPMVLLEAMHASVPIVTTAVGGIPDVVSTQDAMLCEAGVVEQIATAFERVIGDEDGARRRAARARQRVVSEFAVDPWVQRHLALYISLIGAE